MPGATHTPQFPKASVVPTQVLVVARTICVDVGQGTERVASVYVWALFVQGAPFAGELHQLMTAFGTEKMGPPGVCPDCTGC